MHLLARFQSSPIQQRVTYRFRTFSHFLQFENLQICFRVFSKWHVPVRVYYRMNIVRCIIFQGSEKDRVKEIKARFVCQWIFNRCWSHVEIQYKKKYKICCTIFYPPRRYNFFFFQSFSFVKPNYTRIYCMNDVGSNLQYLQYYLLNILVEE